MNQTKFVVATLLLNLVSVSAALAMGPSRPPAAYLVCRGKPIDQYDSHNVLELRTGEYRFYLNSAYNDEISNHLVTSNVSIQGSESDSSVFTVVALDGGRRHELVYNKDSKDEWNATVVEKTVVTTVREMSCSFQ